MVREVRGTANLLIQTAEGQRLVMVKSWTDYGDKKEKPDVPNSDPHLLDYDGLAQAADLIERLRQRMEEGEKEEKTCQSEEQDYDRAQQEDEGSSEVKSC